MDVERMHDMIEKLSEVAKCEIDKGIENVDTCEMGQVVDMLKDLSEAMYGNSHTLWKILETKKTWRCLIVMVMVVDSTITTATLMADSLQKVTARAEVMRNVRIIT